MPASTVCQDCQRTTPTAKRGRCPRCYQAWSKRDGQRRNARPHANIYGDKRWPPSSRACMIRCHWRCVDCVRHITQLRALGLRLMAHHIIPVLQCPDPFDVNNLEALCSECHGRRDGGRRHEDAFFEGSRSYVGSPGTELEFAL